MAGSPTASQRIRARLALSLSSSWSASWSQSFCAFRYLSRVAELVAVSAIRPHSADLRRYQD